MSIRWLSDGYPMAIRCPSDVIWWERAITDQSGYFAFYIVDNGMWRGQSDRFNISLICNGSLCDVKINQCVLFSFTSIVVQKFYDRKIISVTVH